MKIIAIGDTHGRNDWKQIINDNEFDKVVFIGDYFDTHENISGKTQLSNFRDIIQYKKDNLDKVILLIGNHDYHYMKYVNEKYSGYQEKYSFSFREAISEALDSNLLQMCFIHDNYLFTHAGVTNTWLESVGYDNEEPLDVFINSLFKHKLDSFKFTYGKNYDPSGNDVDQTPIWVRPNSLLMDGVDDYVQIVGHTQQHNINNIINRVILIDTIGLSEEYLSIDNHNISVLKINKKQ